MLSELHLENLGVIDHLEVVFGSGMTVVSGETGAGKTLIVEAIELLVGGRADASIVRSGATEARVDGRFVTPGGDELVVSRVIPVNGRSRAYLNGRPSTVTAVAEACRSLVDLHGQHAHQSLLSASTQRSAVDRLGRVDLSALEAARDRLTEVEAALFALGGDERERAREVDLLRYQVNELDDARLSDPDEDGTLERTEEVLADASAHREAGQAALDRLEGEGGGRDLIAAAMAALDDRAPYREVGTRLAGLLAELDDVVSLVRSTTEDIEEDPEALVEVRQRRQRLAELRRKYGSDLSEVIAYAAEARRRLTELESFEERTAALAAEREAARAVLDEAAAEVGRARRAVAPELAGLVQERLRELALPAARVGFAVADVAEDPAADRLEMVFTANPDGEPQPLAKVASGGELARVMLALRLVLMEADRRPPTAGGDAEAGSGEGEHAHRDGPGTLVFDEVDAGLGGAAAMTVGRALARLADRYQVFVVTHLAQVAAGADHQLVVAKSIDRTPDGERTRVSAHGVVGADRVDELARMLAGAVTETARSHAAELLTGSPQRAP